MERKDLDAVVVGEANLLEEAREGRVAVEPDLAPLAELVGLLDTFEA